MATVLGFLFWFFAAAPAAHADATADCSADVVNVVAPSTYASAACDGGGATDACALVCSEWICDMANLGCDTAGEPATAYLVEDYEDASTYELVAWGTCNGVNFCCTWDDTAPASVTHVTLKGGPGDDSLNFSWDFDLLTNPVKDKNELEPYAAREIIAKMYGYGGNDFLEASHFDGADYRESVYGDGNDTIDGNHGAEYINGGAGNDTCFGDKGNDRIDCGPGDDDLGGGEGHDMLCDSSSNGGGTCATNNLHNFSGGPGNDTMYYEYAAGCTAITINEVTSSMGTGYESCGHQSWGDLPTDCDVTTLTTRPTECDDPN